MHDKHGSVPFLRIRIRIPRPEGYNTNARKFIGPFLVGLVGIQLIDCQITTTKRKQTTKLQFFLLPHKKSQVIMEGRLNGGLAKTFSKHDKNLVERLLKECDPDDILASFRTANLRQSTEKEELILSTIHKSFYAKSERKDATLADIVHLVVEALSKRSEAVDLTTASSEPVQRLEPADQAEIERPFASMDYEIVTLSPEQIEGINISRLVTAEGDDIGPYYDGHGQAQRADCRQVALPVQVSFIWKRQLKD